MFSVRALQIFYEMSKGATEDQRNKWALSTMEDVHYLNQSGCFDRRDGLKDEKGFEWTRNAMSVMDFPESEQQQISVPFSHASKRL